MKFLILLSSFFPLISFAQVPTEQKGGSLTCAVYTPAGTSQAVAVKRDHFPQQKMFRYTVGSITVDEYYFGCQTLRVNAFQNGQLIASLDPENSCRVTVGFGLQMILQDQSSLSCYWENR